MRSFLRVFLLGIVVVVIAYFGACLITKESSSQAAQAFNAYNVLVKREPKYVKIDNKEAKDEDGYGNYTYDLKSYDDAGNEHSIKFMGMGKLKQGHYLELDTKGSYVYSYKEVFEKEIPSDVYTKLNL
ncbi:YxeA family protein [Companilactobacillus huachuanensis]|uniref:YxeA family protein n=1 Tax=Companilactobacillus huachuanensis TaxID=2559914 RepID=A0ABW1RMV0_9LACO|nr:YxeA family protein [Companilactobacillus huachuanensis]